MTSSNAEPGPADLTFADLHIHPSVLQAVADVGYESPSPIQAATIPAMLEGSDVVGLAQTGTGKTAAFAIPTRALENHVYYLAVNRAGEERGFAFIGGSRLCGLDGSVLAKTETVGEESFSFDVDLTLARNKRIVRVPGLHVIDRFADRRPEMYGPLVDPLPFVAETPEEANLMDS